MYDLPKKYMDSLLMFSFRFHPRQRYIVHAMQTNQLTSSEINELFAEADAYMLRRLLNYSPTPDQHGFVTFKINRGKNGN